ncbi:unnamed protein product [Leuciscus chuanchicus]
MLNILPTLSEKGTIQETRDTDINFLQDFLQEIESAVQWLTGQRHKPLLTFEIVRLQLDLQFLRYSANYWRNYNSPGWLVRDSGLCPECSILSILMVLKIESFVEDVVPLYSPSEFGGHVRLSKEPVEDVITTLAPVYMNLQQTKLPLTNSVLTCLWTLANQESYRGVADRFNMSKSTLAKHLHEFCCNVNSYMAHHISWPRGQGWRWEISGTSVTSVWVTLRVGMMPEHFASQTFVMFLKKILIPLFHRECT